MIPGSNLLVQAFQLIAKESATYYAFNGRTLNINGDWISTYNAPVTIMGSFQPVSRNLYQVYGLDLTKSYYVFYLANLDVLDLERDISPDLIVYNGFVYQSESDNTWFSQDGWKGVLLTLSDLPVPA